MTPSSLLKSLLFVLPSVTICTAAGLSSSSLENHVDTLTLSKAFNPVEAAYWTGYPHHRRTNFAISPDGKTAYLAYLDSDGEDVLVQPVDPTTFSAVGTSVTVTGAKEAGGLVAHDDGFALLTNEALPTGTTDAPADSTPVAVLYRYDTSGEQVWKTFLGGPGVEEDFGLVASPDLNGDLVYSEEAGYYAAYIVVTAYTGSAAGHYGDAVRYVDASTGALKTISGASSNWGCSHNTGIAIEAADAVPFATVCAEDQGAIWLNTKGQGMTTVGVKVSNEHTINGGSGEVFGGMSGSYSALARFADSSKYVLAWVSRGATTLSENTWMGSGYTKAENRTAERHVAIAVFSDKYTLVGSEASSEVGDTDGDSQINWVTTGPEDASNAHVAVFDSDYALVTWEEITNPICDFDAMGCRGQFSGTKFQLVGSDGSKVGSPIESTDTYVAGDMVTMPDGRICWPYISMDWDLSKPAASLDVATSTKASFACISLNGSSSANTTSSSSAASVVSPSASSSLLQAEVTSSLVTEAETTTTSAPTSTALASTEASLVVGSTTVASVFTTGELAPSTSASSSPDAASTTTQAPYDNSSASTTEWIPSTTSTGWKAHHRNSTLTHPPKPITTWTRGSHVPGTASFSWRNDTEACTISTKIVTVSAIPSALSTPAKFLHAAAATSQPAAVVTAGADTAHVGLAVQLACAVLVFGRFAM
ncbi:Muc1 extracellular alpha glucan glucosidase-like [Pleurostoma richardsiae]|uniref:Muc1 extracellular alpha glucan glucosidase-like n=1 Tax=Pleurostoma richardsiae TaxID=41990 RepID=A0AA38VR88_9PEZI|nr:Muc1 extracellular alpha glucan glucosidase-like [Pleurostoma richardsiae]